MAQAFILLVCTKLLLGCASVAEQAEEPSNRVPLSCTANVFDTITEFNWELTVDSDPIEAGKPFTVSLGGAVVVPPLNIDAAQIRVPEGFGEVNLVDFKATVHVRSGAVGADKVLDIEEITYRCFLSRTECDPAHDLEGIPGLVGNTDCQPEEQTNPCGRFIRVPTSSDCEPGGACDELGKTGPASQCDLNGFCVTGGIRVPFKTVTAEYVAMEDHAEVLFGWDDENTGATVQEGGPNDGSWILPPAVYEEPPRSTGIRLTARGFPLALECTMGVPCRTCAGDPDVDSNLGRPAPDSRLISLPIQ